jgi:hypothetical protein
VAFHIPRVNVVASDAGYSVEVLSPTKVRFMENEEAWIVETEMLLDDAVPLVVYEKTLRRTDKSDGSDAVHATRRHDIIGKIREAFRYQGVDIQLM